MNPVLIITFCVVLTAFFIFIAIYRRVATTSQLQQQWTESLGPAAAELRGNNPLVEQVNRRLGRSSMASGIEQQLLAADSKMSVSEYVLLRIGATVLALVLGRLISGYWLGGALLAVFGWLAPSWQLSWQRNKRARDFERQLPNMLGLLVGSLRAGYGLLQACRVVKQEMPDPMSTELGRVLKESSLGVSLDDALDHLAQRIQNDDLAMVVTSIQVQSEVGGNLAEVLDSISETIRNRIELRGEINVLTAQQRMTGWILTALPFALGTAMMLLNPGYMMQMFQPGWPILIPISAVLMMIVGNIVMRQMVKIDI